ncbi:putative E7 oncogenic protein [Eptesicus serotinus papillomavirus 2]|uniref:Protein E7 n=1 Tax=Eptesicus serotinus papillomavirus 2 TaxID=1464072 RepID=W8EAA8_9PAPI|nr:putative E7 oncogenic protein [Eptesicus serotinus papillomavirus 2]AHJ81391.1 putative E7 oncogenic protein [Eptesicus serotinus papillomavirus 2]
MIGNAPTLKDIVLTEIPEAVDLLCHETMPSEEELGAGDSHSGNRPRAQQVHVILTWCGRCDQDIRVCIETEQQSLVILESLLLKDLQILCPECYQNL